MTRKNLGTKFGRKMLVTGGLLAILNGCDISTTRIDWSGTQYADAVVTNRAYTSERTESSISPKIAGSGAIGIGLNGVGVSVGGLVFSSEDIPENYRIDFKSSNTTFIVEGSGEKYKKFYEQFQTGEVARVSYRTLNETTSLGISKVDGKEITEKRIVSYDFLDVTSK